jgi:hypothetical protein
MKRPQKLAVMLVPTPPYEICGLGTHAWPPLELSIPWGIQQSGFSNAVGFSIRWRDGMYP